MRRAARAYLQLMRLDKPVGALLCFFPAGWAVALASHERQGGLDTHALLICALGALVVRALGCVLNDLTDRRLDRAVARTRERPLACGAVSVRGALALATLLALLALALVLKLPRLCLWIALLSLPLIALYPWMKRITWWPQAVLGVTFNTGALIGWAAVTGTLAAPAFWLYAGALFWTFGYDTVYALQDAKDDEAAGIKSSARALGERLTPAVRLAYLLAWGCWALAGWSAGPAFFGGWALAGVLMAVQARAIGVLSPARLFAANIYVGMALFAGALLALWL